MICMRKTQNLNPCRGRPLRKSLEFSAREGLILLRSHGTIMTSQEIAVNVPNTLDPVYSNMIQIAYKEDEFTFVFLHQIPGVNQARAKAIVSITPQHAKALLSVFSKTMADFESKFGKVEPPQGKQQGESVTTIRGYS